MLPELTMPKVLSDMENKPHLGGQVNKASYGLNGLKHIVRLWGNLEKTPSDNSHHPNLVQDQVAVGKSIINHNL